MFILFLYLKMHQLNIMNQLKEQEIRMPLVLLQIISSATIYIYIYSMFIYMLYPYRI